MLLGPYLSKLVLIPANNDFRRQKSPRIIATMNRCHSAPLWGIATTHNPHTTQKITDRKQVVCRVVGHNYSSSTDLSVFLSLCLSVTPHCKRLQATHLFLKHFLLTCKGETITRVNGKVSFFAGKCLQNF